MAFGKYFVNILLIFDELIWTCDCLDALELQKTKNRCLGF